MPLILDVRIDGFPEPIGALARDDDKAISFAYSPRHLAEPYALPLSLALPLTDEPYRDVAARAFFDNLLQERDSDLAALMAREGIARDDLAGLLFHLGKDCAGAISVLPAGAPPVKVPGEYDKDYQAIEPDRLQAIVTALHDRSRLPDGTADPSPLAGMQSKIALTLLPNGTLALPVLNSGAPTTHILKIPDRGHLQDALLEASALDLSKLAGFDSARAVALDFKGIPALLVARFDRAHDAQGKIVRIHQEDFAQALGLPPSLKYERRGKPGRRFDAEAIRNVLTATVDPAGETLKFIRIVLFDLMIGNSDGHAKNFALLHERGGRPRLAPRYDVLPTRLDPNLTDELAFTIGSAKTLDEVDAEAFDAFLFSLGVRNASAQKRLRAQNASAMADVLASRLDEIGRLGMKRFADMIASNIRTLADALDIETPAGVRDRDTFMVRAGGWQMR